MLAIYTDRRSLFQLCRFDGLEIEIQIVKRWQWSLTGFVELQQVFAGLGGEAFPDGVGAAFLFTFLNCCCNAASEVSDFDELDGINQRGDGQFAIGGSCVFQA